MILLLPVGWFAPSDRGLEPCDPATCDAGDERPGKERRFVEWMPADGTSTARSPSTEISAHPVSTAALDNLFDLTRLRQGGKPAGRSVRAYRWNPGSPRSRGCGDPSDPSSMSARMN